MEINKNIFVFALCGANSHIETLKFSIKYLKYFTKNEIIVVTDFRRNNIDIEHYNVIDVKTPKGFTNHQASIFLKTSLHKILPKGNLYCYLDTDVIALNKKCKHIFKEYQSPITFALDNLTLSAFSPFAVNCNCSLKVKQRKKLLKIIDKYGINDKSIIKKREQLQLLFNENNKFFIKRFLSKIKFILSRNIYKFNNKFSFDKNKKKWKDNNTGEIIMYDFDINKKIEEETGLLYDAKNKTWQNKLNENVLIDNCYHLLNLIEDKFQIKNINHSWQHWNGGVFLFDDNSYNFLDSWHNKTMKIFKDKQWKTRDQGTLIATVWEFNLENHKTLSSQWNFLADFNNEQIELDLKNEVFKNNKEKNINVNFIHVYHHWGDEKWYIWNWIKKLM